MNHVERAIIFVLFGVWVIGVYIWIWTSLAAIKNLGFWSRIGVVFSGVWAIFGLIFFLLIIPDVPEAFFRWLIVFIGPIPLAWLIVWFGIKIFKWVLAGREAGRTK